MLALREKAKRALQTDTIHIIAKIVSTFNPILVFADFFGASRLAEGQDSNPRPGRSRKESELWPTCNIFWDK